VGVKVGIGLTRPGYLSDEDLEGVAGGMVLEMKD